MRLDNTGPHTSINAILHLVYEENDLRNVLGKNIREGKYRGRAISGAKLPGGMSGGKCPNTNSTDSALATTVHKCSKKH